MTDFWAAKILSVKNSFDTQILQEEFSTDFHLNHTVPKTRQIDLDLHYLAYECCNLTSFSSEIAM